MSSQYEVNVLDKLTSDARTDARTHAQSAAQNAERNE